jgi:hypothetical protein
VGKFFGRLFYRGQLGNFIRIVGLVIGALTCPITAGGGCAIIGYSQVLAAAVDASYEISVSTGAIEGRNQSRLESALGGLGRPGPGGEIQGISRGTGIQVDLPDPMDQWMDRTRPNVPGVIFAGSNGRPTFKDLDPSLDSRDARVTPNIPLSLFFLVAEELVFDNLPIPEDILIELPDDLLRRLISQRLARETDEAALFIRESQLNGGQAFGGAGPSLAALQLGVAAVDTLPAKAGASLIEAAADALAAGAKLGGEVLGDQLSRSSDVTNLATITGSGRALLEDAAGDPVRRPARRR